jgi:beta-N-acetylhexosaminidase
VTIQRELGRLLWIGFEGTSLDVELEGRLARGEAGGVTLFARNLPQGSGGTDLKELAELNSRLHAAGARAGAPLLISVDQEGGRVQRVREPARRWPAMFELAGLPDEEAVRTAREWGAEMGKDLREWGFDIDFAPVLDVHTNSENPIIGDRAFSDQPGAAALRALAFAEGLSAAGIIGCGKHFPGHGDTSTDSHLTLPRLDHDMARLEQVELLPFRRAIDAGIPMIMTAHVVFAALDGSVPATLSPKVVRGLLREKLGYDGVVVSDDLDMKAVADNFGVGEAALMAIVAGCDVLLLCRNREHQEEAREALIAEAEKSAAFRDIIGRAVARVARLRRLVHT